MVSMSDSLLRFSLVVLTAVTQDLYIIGACGVIGLFLHPNVTVSQLLSFALPLTLALLTVQLVHQCLVGVLNLPGGCRSAPAGEAIAAARLLPDSTYSCTSFTPPPRPWTT